MEQIINYIKPELLVLIPVLYFIGIGIKKSKIKDNYIPLILGTIGIVLSLLYVLATSIGTPQELAIAVFVGITQGVLCAGCSVYVDQLVKQGKE